MSQKEAFLQAIREAPNDDTHRLVYADWLTDYGEATHAQLIRVQCELADKKCQRARRKELRAEEARLLEDPTLHADPENPFAYVRGFVEEHCKLYFDGEVFHLTNREDPGEGDVPLTATNLALLDRCLDLGLDLNCLERLHDSWDDSFFAACLRRVVELECTEGYANAADMARLAASPDLVAMDRIRFEWPFAISLPGAAALFAAPASPGVWYLCLACDTCWDEDDDLIEEDDAEEIADFVRRIGQDPRAARLTHFVLDLQQVSVGDVIAGALLDSPHLHPAYLELNASPALSPTQKRALKKRFGKALRSF
jgi:uncharacterized protein (TIGR02996 family)